MSFSLLNFSFSLLRHKNDQLPKKKEPKNTKLSFLYFRTYILKPPQLYLQRYQNNTNKTVGPRRFRDIMGFFK